MKYAKLIKLQGELIPAEDADYQDYFGFLACNVCNEPVFLRKAHTRGNIEIPAAFVHHKAKDDSSCELRVARYEAKDIEIINRMAHGQRMAKLRISMWKIIKKSLAFNFSLWPQLKQDINSSHILKRLTEYGEFVICLSPEFMLDTLTRLSEMVITQSSLIQIESYAENAINDFVTKRNRDWYLHEKLAKEALKVFIYSNEMSPIRMRVMECICHPQAMMSMPQLCANSVKDDLWSRKFKSYLTLEVPLIFLTIDWLEVF